MSQNEAGRSLGLGWKISGIKLVLFKYHKTINVGLVDYITQFYFSSHLLNTLKHALFNFKCFVSTESTKLQFFLLVKHEELGGLSS